MTVNLTFDVADITGIDFDARRTKVYIRTNVPEDVIIDATGNKIYLGHARATINADGTGSFTGLIATNAATNPTAFQYRVVIDYPDRDAPSGRGSWNSGWFSLTATSDLADVVASVYVPPTWQNDFTASMDAIRDDATAARDAAVDISNIDTSDDVVEALLKGTAGAGPKTRAQLNASFVAKVKPSGDATGVTDTAAVQAVLDAGGRADLTAGATYYIKGLVAKDDSTLALNKATVMLPNGANDDVIVSSGFDALTGTDTATATGAGVVGFQLLGPGVIDGNKANQTMLGTTIAAASDGAALPQGTVNVASTTGFPASGTFTVYVDIDPARPLGGAGVQTFSYTGKTSTSFTGVVALAGGTGTLRLGDPVHGKGYGVRLYGRNFRIGGHLLQIRNCVVDGMWSEWGNGGATATKDTGAMEAEFGPMKMYNNGRNGWTFYGPHDSNASQINAYANGISGICVMRGAAYNAQFHGWGSPQRYSLDLYGAASFDQAIAEVPNVAGSIAVRIHGVAVAYKGTVLTPGSSPNAGAVGIVMTGTPTRCKIDAQVRDCPGGAIIAYGDGGQNEVKVQAVQANGGAILRALTVVAAASNGVNVNTFAGAGTLNVVDTTSFAASGAVMVGTASGFQLVTYTAKTGTTLTGCTSAGAGVISTNAMVSGVNQIAGGAANSTGSNIDPTSTYEITTAGGTTARPYVTKQLTTKSSGTVITPSATANTYGTAYTVTAPANRPTLKVTQVGVFGATNVNTGSSESLTIQVTATYDDGSTVTNAISTTLTTVGGSIALSNSGLSDLLTTDRHLISVGIAVRSNLASSTATVKAIVSAA